jgi:hypothetical protein
MTERKPLIPEKKDNQSRMDVDTDRAVKSRNLPTFVLIVYLKRSGGNEP